MSTYLRMTGLGLAFGWSIFQLAVALSPGLQDMVFLPVHAFFAVAVSLAMAPAWEKAPDSANPALPAGRGTLDIAFSVVGIVVAVLLATYFIFNADSLSRRIPLVQRLDGLQLAIGIATIIFVLEAARRTAGLGMLVVVVVFIAYGIFGWVLPGGLATTPVALGDFVDQLVFTTNGVFGVPLAVSATYVFYFVLFAGFLEFSGGGRLFIDVALGLTRGARGGPAKAAVIGSGLMGMTSGSAVANVVSTGVFTIPLMKAAGYTPRMAAAVEALASTGAQIMPPLMGAAAFIMANTLGVGYGDIITAAALPALLYFATVFIAVDLEARRRGLKVGAGQAKEVAPTGDYLKRVHLLLPLVYLIYAVVSGRSLMMSALEAMGLVVVVSWFRRETRLYPKDIIEILAKGGSRVISVAVPCAAAGIVVGVVAQTGIGLRFSEFLVGLSSNNVLLALIVVMFGCLVMGMGLPTTAAYIMAATLFAPALIHLGITPIAAHMFVFYFACLSMITPPVALASYAAASVAGTSAMATGWTAALIGIPLFLLPYAFVADPALLGQASILEGAVRFVVALIGMGAFVAAIGGYMLKKNTLPETALLLLGACGVIFPATYANLTGGVLLGLALALQIMRGHKKTGALV